MNQLTFDDIYRSKSLSLQPGRTAFVDECGNFGFDFSKEGTSLFYIVCAVIVKNNQIEVLENAINKISRNYFGGGEMKSSHIAQNNGRRAKVCAELLMLDFSLIILIADKQAFFRDSPLTDYKDPFVKFLHRSLYNVMYSAYPKLKIVEDEYGSSEFQKSYREYVISHRPEINLLNEYDFDYIDSKQSPLVQVADIIVGSIMQHFIDNNAPDILRLFQGMIRGIINFPSMYSPYFAGGNVDNRFDEKIYALADHCSMNYIDSHHDINDEDVRLRVLFLRHLLFVVRNVNASKFVSSSEIIRVLSDLSDNKVRRDYLYRRIIAPLRDAGVIIASSSQGYQIPICIDDIFLYANQTNGIVGPMLSRVQKCRELILMQTDGSLDIFNDPALVKYKRYFGDY
jgi:hypothetical protein